MCSILKTKIHDCYSLNILHHICIKNKNDNDNNNNLSHTVKMEQYGEQRGEGLRNCITQLTTLQHSDMSMKYLRDIFTTLYYSSATVF